MVVTMISQSSCSLASYPDSFFFEGAGDEATCSYVHILFFYLKKNDRRTIDIVITDTVDQNKWETWNQIAT